VSETRKLKIARTSITKPKAVEAAPTADQAAITNWEGTTPSGEPIKVVEHQPLLRPGDRVEYGVTHEIDVDGEKAWVKYGVNVNIADGESMTEVNDRVVAFVNQTVVNAATQVANQILRG
jgi:hypothetical protein